MNECRIKTIINGRVSKMNNVLSPIFEPYFLLSGHIDLLFYLKPLLKTTVINQGVDLYPPCYREIRHAFPFSLSTFFPAPKLNNKTSPPLLRQEIKFCQNVRQFVRSYSMVKKDYISNTGYSFMICSAKSCHISFNLNLECKNVTFENSTLKRFHL